MGSHSIVGASAMNRWGVCTSSPSLILTLPVTERNRGSKFADEGSSAHRLCDLGVQHINDLLRKGENLDDVLHVNLLGSHVARYIDHDDFEVVGENPFNGEQLAYEHEVLTGFNDNHFVCDVEMQSGVRLYLFEIIKIIKEIQANGGEPEIWPETRCFPIPDRKDVFGTSDCVIVDLHNQKVWVIDFKYGRRIVHAQDNQQALFYAAGSLAEYHNDIRPDAEVKLMIIQPRVEFDDGRSISEAVYAASEIYEWVEGTLKPAVIATQSPALAKYEMGDHCEFCPAAGICPLMQETALRKAQEAFSGDIEALTFEDIPEVELILPDPTDGEAMSAALKVGAVLKAWTTRVEEMADSLGTRGQKIPGFKVVRRGTHWRWKDPQAVVERLREHGTLEQGTDTKPKTVAQMRASGALSEEDFGELAEKPEGALVLAPESDRRKPVESAADKFASAD